MFVTKIQMRLHKELYPKKNSFSLLKDYCIFVIAKIRGHDVSFEALKAVFLKKLWQLAMLLFRQVLQD